jgi:hypothetical protein
MSGARLSFSCAIKASPDCPRRVARACSALRHRRPHRHPLALMSAWTMPSDGFSSNATHRLGRIRRPPSARRSCDPRVGGAFCRKADACGTGPRFGERRRHRPSKPRVAGSSPAGRAIKVAVRGPATPASRRPTIASPSKRYVRASAVNLSGPARTSRKS